jgi:sporulation protein YlmC with PRC-barrel domain
MNRVAGHMAITVLLASGVAIAIATATRAQNGNGAGSSSSASGTSGSSALALADKAPNGSLVTTNGDWRGSELLGATVYNDQGDSIGTVNDLLLSSDGTFSNAVLSVGGFLGMGSKLIEVPFKNLKFVPSLSNPASGSKMATQVSAPAAPAPANRPDAGNSAAATGTVVGAPGTTIAGTTIAGTTIPGTAVPATATFAPPVAGSHDFSLVLPGATKQSLTSDSTFKFAD